jgi:alginate O-acetyltransferase complex protein AlgI
VVVGGIVLLAATLALGFAVARIRPPATARWAAWGLALAAAVAAERLTAGEPAGFRMLAILGTLLYGMKGVVAVEAAAGGAGAGSPESRDRGGERLGPAAWLGFAALWPGMRPTLFARRSPGRLPGAGTLLGRGLVRLLAGALLVVAAREVARRGGALLLATALALPGLSLALHFGIFNLIAGGWRLAGVNAKPLFRAPLRSTSLTEFWGRRWNLAFSEMTSLAVYRPLRGRWGVGPATAAAFFASGLLHEAAISLPVGAGFGLPLAYFALHGALMAAERRFERAGRPLAATPWLGRAWTLGWLALPLPILFHRPFLAGIVWPLIGVQ